MQLKMLIKHVDNQLKDDSTNVYMILFIIGLIVSAFLIGGGIVFYCRRHDTKKIKQCNLQCNVF